MVVLPGFALLVNLAADLLWTKSVMLFSPFLGCFITAFTISIVWQSGTKTYKGKYHSWPSQLFS